MESVKPVSTPLANHFKLSKENCASSEKEKKMMKGVPYSSAVGSLMYAMVCTRPDIAHAVGVVSRYLSNPGRKHWEAVKWILRYLKGTSKLCLCYGGAKPILEGYTDADMAGDLDSRKSTSSYIFTLAGGAVSWQSKLRKCVALSTTEAEYIAAVEAGKELMWLKRFLQELGFRQEEYTIHCDSQSALDLSKNSMYHSRTKHIDVRYHWLREAVEQQDLKLSKIDTNDNPADMLTKVVPYEKHKLCSDIVGLRSIQQNLEGEICYVQPQIGSLKWTRCTATIVGNLCSNGGQSQSSMILPLNDLSLSHTVGRLIPSKCLSFSPINRASICRFQASKTREKISEINT